MRVVIAPDSFKECAPASVVAQAIARGVRNAAPDAEIACVPMADGGDGTLDAVLAAIGGERVRARCRGPLGESREAEYGVFEGGRIALIEMATACGLALIPREKRNPGVTTTVGLGDLIRHALDRGVDRVIIGLGGSATNDAGAGMAQALGYRLLDSNRAELAPGGLALSGLARIDEAKAHPRIREVAFVGACDVTNRLCGPRGASFMYGAQKGADAGMIAELDDALHHFGRVARRHFGVDVLDTPGSGAAGGFGAGILTFLHGELKPGFELIAELAGLKEAMRGADLVITGEGRLDGQSAFGKVPAGVARMAKELGVPAAVIAGQITAGREELDAMGFADAESLMEDGVTFEDSMSRAQALIEEAAARIARRYPGASDAL